MTLEFWLQAEQFYYFWIWLIGALLAVSLIVAIFTKSYGNEKKGKTLNRVLSLFALVLVGAGLFGHLRYRDYLPQETYLTPLTRDRVPRFAGYNYHSQTEEMIYIRHNDHENLQNLAMYEGTSVEEPIVYLGKSGNDHYFETSEGARFRKNERHVRFSDSVERASIVGNTFLIKDDSFKYIGFKNPANVMFSHIEIPTAQRVELENELGEGIQKTEEIFRNWNF